MGQEEVENSEGRQECREGKISCHIQQSGEMGPFGVEGAISELDLHLMESGSMFLPCEYSP